MRGHFICGRSVRDSISGEFKVSNEGMSHRDVCFWCLVDIKQDA